MLLGSVKNVQKIFKKSIDFGLVT